MLEILTPLNKLERVSRQITPATFVAAPGIWAQVGDTGGLINVSVGVNSLINKLVIGSASSNQYESHDVAVGRITTLESIGVRCKVGTEGFATGTTHNVDKIELGSFLIVSSIAGSLGKLVLAVRGATSGQTYEIVARCEQIADDHSYMIFKTLSPTTFHIS